MTCLHKPPGNEQSNTIVITHITCPTLRGTVDKVNFKKVQFTQLPDVGDKINLSVSVNFRVITIQYSRKYVMIHVVPSTDMSSKLKYQVLNQLAS